MEDHGKEKGLFRLHSDAIQDHFINKSKLYRFLLSPFETCNLKPGLLFFKAKNYAQR